MTPRMNIEPERRPSSSRFSLQAMDQITQPGHSSSFARSAPDVAFRPIQDDELFNQDSLSLCSTSHGTSSSMDPYWNLNDTEILDRSAMTCSEPESQSPEVQMAFPMSQQLLPSSTFGQDDILYSNASPFASAVPHVTTHLHHDLDFAQAAAAAAAAPQDFHGYSPLEDLVFDNDTTDTQNDGPQDCHHDDALSSSIGHASALTDGNDTSSEFVGADDAWSSLQGPSSTLDQISSSFFPSVPVSPPLTEASNDTCVTSSCPNTGYPSLTAHDDVLFSDVTMPIGNQSVGLEDPLFPVTPPSTAHDPNRTIRPSKKRTRRPALSATVAQFKAEQDRDCFQSLPAQQQEESSRRESKDGAAVAEFTRNPREHPYYSMPTHGDGKYYCPFAAEDNNNKPCAHPPTTQKCAYHKYLDSHLKPYRCKVPACSDAQLQFSSNACLFRHEREAHGLHGHGDNPHLCLFEGCERSIPGYGFPRRWNLYDHMRRVHDYVSDQPISPENSPRVVGQNSTTSTRTNSTSSRKKGNSGRKRKTNNNNHNDKAITGSQVVKRSRSNQSQRNPVKPATTATISSISSSGQREQRLQDAERTYFNCRARLLDELSRIIPQDPSMHEKVNASLQELITLGLNYRHIEASHVAS